MWSFCEYVHVCVAVEKQFSKIAAELAGRKHEFLGPVEFFGPLL